MKNILTPYYYIILLLCITLQITYAQAPPNRFYAGMLMGLNLSQIHGDLQQGYHKKGYSLGLSGGFNIKPAWDMSAEMYFNSRGAIPNPRQKNIRADEIQMNIHLQAADIFLVNHIRFAPNSEYYKQAIQLGFGYGRILKRDIKVLKDNNSIAELETDFRQNIKTDDLSVMVGWSYLITPRIGFVARHIVSLRPIYGSSNSDTNLQRSNFTLRPYYISLHLIYNMIAPKMKLKPNNKKVDNKVSKLEEV